MKKTIIFLIFIISTLSFGKINDKGNYLNDSDKQKIEKKILNIEKNNDIVYYVNLGRKIDDKDLTEKTIILNIIPDGKNNVNVQLKFTQDIDASAYEDRIENVLIEGEKEIGKKEYTKFVLNVLNVSDGILKNIKNDQKNTEIQKQEQEKKSTGNKMIEILILLFIVVVVILGTLKIKKVRSLKK